MLFRAAIEPFTRKYISETVLRRLIGQKMYFSVQPEESELCAPSELSAIWSLTTVEDEQGQGALLYEYGKPADYFIMILEGRVRVVVGNERLTYESGPFTYFGVSALRPPEILGRSRRSESISMGGLTMGGNPNTVDSTTNSTSRPPSPESVPLLSGACNSHGNVSRPGSPDLSNLMHSPSASSEALGLPPYASSSQLLNASAVSGPMSGVSDRPSLAVAHGHTFVPDFWVQAMQTTIYMKIPRKVYLAAVRASLLDRRDEFVDSELEQFREEVDSLIYSQLASKGSGSSTAPVSFPSRIKKSPSDVMREKKLSLAGVSPKLASSAGPLIDSAGNSAPIKRKSSLFPAPLSSPKAGRKSVFGANAALDVGTGSRPNSGKPTKTDVVLELGTRDASQSKNA
jgi:hypothetical protein